MSCIKLQKHSEVCCRKEYFPSCQLIQTTLNFLKTFKSGFSVFVSSVVEHIATLPLRSLTTTLRGGCCCYPYSTDEEAEGLSSSLGLTQPAGDTARAKLTVLLEQGALQGPVS